MFGIPAILNQSNTKIFETAGFCPLDLSTFNRYMETVPVSITQGGFCPLDLSTFTRYDFILESEPLPPTYSPQVGNSWYKPSTQIVKYWNGSSWV